MNPLRSASDFVYVIEQFFRKVTFSVVSDNKSA